MNKQDYEQKKRECWENVKFAFSAPNTDRKTFDFIFDRAYALGREKETITQEEIEKASVEFADREYEIGQVDWDALYKGYSHGMKDSLGKQEKDAEETKSDDSVTISLHVAVIPRQEEFYMGVDASHEAYTIDISKSMIPSDLLAVINGECKNKLVTNIAIMK